MISKEENPAPEFSRMFAIEPDMGAGAEATSFAIEAEADERAGLARRFGLLSLDALTAEGRIHVFESGTSVRLEGHVKADLVQACVVTLEPVPAHVEEDFVLHYRRAAAGGPTARGPREVEVALEDGADWEPIPEAGIDVGEAAAECLGLAIDPYPRAADAEGALSELLGPADETAKKSPFDALKRLKKK
ncbi:MAG: DUF177 domain-containing protein [Alphaproteobacteria bacterium]|nr:DUF177 domain-containing protein [Alphaproteobacteria bacterium]